MMEKRMPQTDLNQEAAKAGTYYVEKKCGRMPSIEQYPLLNACAAGFAMGVRWYEKRLQEQEEAKRHE